LLAPTRRLIQPIGGVDVAPVVWVGLISLARELLVGQQGLLTQVLRQSQVVG
jgi:YggT family protein